MSRPTWRPTADPAIVQLRAQLLAKSRAFFAARGIIEVETPTLSRAAVSDPHLESLQTRLARAPDQPLFLHTSPELAMKRLVAAGYGDIFQICRVYRDGELGRTHQPEFTLLEWYRVGMSEQRLMTEVAELMSQLLGATRVGTAADSISYRRAFQVHLGLDPMDLEPGALLSALASRGHCGLDVGLSGPPLLDLAFSLAIAPQLGRDQATFVVDYPADQAALAGLKSNGLAKRFELFIDGLELANGFGELTDASEQRQRFENDLAQRKRQRQVLNPLDEDFLAALAAGLPQCAGVAVGFDRLVMLAGGLDHIDAVLTFPHTQDGAGGG